MKASNFNRPISKAIGLIALLGALGNLLSILSTALGNIHPQIAVDLSHIATIMAASMMGAIGGLAVGAISSITPYIRFGPMGYLGPLVGLLIFPGKAMTGAFAGILIEKLKRPSISLIIGYVPESLFTWLSFKVWIPLLLPQMSRWITDPIVYGILIKAWFEILIIAALSEKLVPKVCDVVGNCLITSLNIKT